MTAEALLTDLTTRGIRFLAVGDRLRFHPASTLTPAERAALRSLKPRLLEIFAVPLPENATPCEIPGSRVVSAIDATGEAAVNLIHDDHDRAVVEYLRGLRPGCPPRPTPKAQSGPPSDSATRDGDRVGGAAPIAPKASIPFPAGWSVTAWRDRLLQLADACAPLHPARAEELRRAADELDIGQLVRHRARRKAPNPH